MGQTSQKVPKSMDRPNCWEFFPFLAIVGGVLGLAWLERELSSPAGLMIGYTERPVAIHFPKVAERADEYLPEGGPSPNLGGSSVTGYVVPIPPPRPALTPPDGA